MSEKPLYILSENYPYGNGEVFLENEVLFLARKFRKITILPRKKLDTIRETPGNVNVEDTILNISFSEYLISFISSLGFIKYWSYFIKAQARMGLKNVTRSIVNFYGYCLDGHIMASRLSKSNIENVILYSYWYKHTAFAISLYEKENVKIVRTHRGDLYEIEHTLPFHKMISEKIHKIYAISKQGAAYLQDNYNISRDKIEVNYLGTFKNETNCTSTLNDSINIVSCSAIVPRKRVDNILDSVYLIAKANDKLSINWTHIGDGEGMTALKSKVKKLPNLKVNFLGHVENNDIQKLYCSGNFDIFINSSTSEGIPVSIMEAVSYGIPVVASDVGGTSEIVTAKTGILVSELPSAEEIADVIQKHIIESKSFNKEESISFWENNFSALENYESFYNSISKLKINNAV